MIPRDCLALSICLLLGAIQSPAAAERWSRQVSNSEWIPLANPRSPVGQSAPIPPLPTLPELNLPPQLRQEYQQQLLQLQKTQESIQKLLVLQQQLRSQQQLLQNQAYLPNVVGPDEEKSLHRGADVLTPPQIPSDPLPPVYSPQEFRHTQLSDEVNRPKDTTEVQNASSSTSEKTEDDEEVQVVYVPAETLAQRGHSKEERNRDQKQFAFPHRSRFQNQESPSSEDASFNQEVYPRGREDPDFLKAIREKELDRLNEQRREIQKQAKLQAAAMQREQERMRQRDSEKKRKELARLEEAAKQRELERIRESRERQRLVELEREKERAARAKQIEIDRLAALERQKKLELEKLTRKEEERAKELAEKREKEASESVQQEYHQYHQQHLTETAKPKLRGRSKSRRPVQHKPIEENIERSHDILSTPAPTPNQPPLAVFMGSEDLEAQEVKVVDVLRVLRDAKTIAVVDQVTPDAPKVFVGPSNLDAPGGYAKFDLPYLSSLDTNRVERRVDKLPFFVAPLSFQPPPGYSKIPFPAPHIGSVIVNTIEGSSGPEGPAKPSPQPLIEPNAFLSNVHPSSTYSPAFETPTTPYSTYTPEHVTPQYQSTPGYSSTPADRFRYRQQFHHLDSQEAVSLSPYQEELTPPPRPHRPDYPEEAALPGPVTPGVTYRKPTLVSSYSFEQEPVSTTPLYQQSYVHTRVQPNREQELTSQLAQINQHDYSQHRHVEDPYQHPAQQAGLTQHHGHHHAGEIESSYEDQRGAVPPTQYNLPAELPPIHPQLPGLINSLVESKDADKVTTTPAPPTTTTEAPTSTHRSRTRQRGRPTRPTTTTPSSVYRGTSERTRRPFNRSRSRYTTTTEEYKETYEPTKTKVETTTRYSDYRRTGSSKAQKIKSRTNERPYESSTLNQIQSIQPHETVSDEANPPVDTVNTHDITYSQYNIPIPVENSPNTHYQESSESSQNSYSPEIDYVKTPNYAHPAPSHRDQRPLVDDTGIPQQHYQDRYQTGLGYQAGLIDSTGELNYRENVDSTLTSSPTPNDYYYPDKSGSVEAGQHGTTPTDAPAYTQILEYKPGNNPESSQHGQLSSEYGQSGQYSGEKNSGSVEDVYSHFSSQEPVEQTTEPAAPTTTEPPATRQRPRGRSGSRTRQDSTIQTHPRGSHDDFVQFSAVNKQPSRSSSRQRESRPRAKPRPQYHSQVQSEGNEYVRIQSGRQNYPKTVIQAAKPTTTTPTPLTTTEEAALQNEEIEYGFIRPPSYNQPQNPISKFRAPDSQIQLQNVAPTDETAEDSSPTHTQVPKHRQKYQSPNRPRPAVKSTASTLTTTPSSEPFPSKPRVRPEEPKNRIRPKVRRPGTRRRPATTTTTTTEYVLDSNNNLPLDENYPRIPISHTESPVDRQTLYDESYEPLPHAPEVATSRVDYNGENYPPQDFVLNFGETAGVDEQHDQTPQTSVTKQHSQGHRHGSAAGRLRSYSQAVVSDRDIYGAESQWSTKLSKSSFQPGLNQLNHDDAKSATDGSEVSKGEAPEIITAQPEEAYVTVLVTSDDKVNETKKASSSEEVSVEAADFGQKMSSEGTTVTSEVSEGTTEIPSKRTAVRRRRVRIRIRPASSKEDFVTSESQHINSAVNNLVHDRTKLEHPIENIRFTTTQETTVAPTTTPTEIPSVDESIGSTDMTTINYTEVPERSELSEASSTTVNNDESQKAETDAPTTTAKPAETTLSDNQTEAPLMTTMTVPRKSWDSTKGYAEWFLKKQFNYYPVEKHDDGDSSSEETSTLHPKNHRSEWSEVRYPGDRGVFGYGRADPTTSGPGLVTKSIGDANAKTLSDYVQAIFDTMKSAEGERAIDSNAPDLWQDEVKPTTSTEVYSLPSDLSTSTELQQFDSSSQNASEQTSTSDVSSDAPTTALSSSTSAAPAESSEATQTTQQSTADPMLASQTNLGAVLRTSTTTKVSHMTEICYRGRCVMTKPRRDLER